MTPTIVKLSEIISGFEYALSQGGERVNTSDLIMLLKEFQLELETDVASTEQQLAEKELQIRKLEKTKANKLAVAEDRVEQLEAALGSLVSLMDDGSELCEFRTNPESGKCDTCEILAPYRLLLSPVQPEAPTEE